MVLGHQGQGSATNNFLHSRCPAIAAFRKLRVIRRGADRPHRPTKLGACELLACGSSIRRSDLSRALVIRRKPLNLLFKGGVLHTQGFENSLL